MLAGREDHVRLNGIDRWLTASPCRALDTMEVGRAPGGACVSMMPGAVADRLAIISRTHGQWDKLAGHRLRLRPILL